jgi:hypothetical protein
MKILLIAPVCPGDPLRPRPAMPAKRAGAARPGQIHELKFRIPQSFLPFEHGFDETPWRNGHIPGLGA